MKGSFGTAGDYLKKKNKKKLKFLGANFEVLKYEELIDRTSEFLSNEKIIGWFQGRMVAPKKDCRSILDDPK